MGFFTKLKEKMTAPPETDKMYEGAMVLMYNLPKDKSLQFEIMCENLGVKTVHIDKEDYLQPIGVLAEVPGMERTDDVYEEDENDFTEIMAVMKNFTGMSMANFKDKMKRTTGVYKFDLETVVHDKNLQMNSIEIRNMLFKKKYPHLAEEVSEEEE